MTAQPHAESLTAADRYDLTVGQVAAGSGIAPSAVRFYERHGLISSRRTASNQRRFAPDAPCRIRVAKVAQRVGLTVREIADIMRDLPDPPACDDWRIVAEALVDEARARMRALQDTLADLESGNKLCELPTER